MTRSMKPSDPTAETWPHITSDITNAAFLSNLRSPAGVVSAGRVTRIARAGASES